MKKLCSQKKKEAAGKSFMRMRQVVKDL
jgi:hypothetical protein